MTKWTVLLPDSGSRRMRKKKKAKMSATLNLFLLCGAMSEVFDIF